MEEESTFSKTAVVTSGVLHKVFFMGQEGEFNADGACIASGKYVKGKIEGHGSVCAQGFEQTPPSSSASDEQSEISSTSEGVSDDMEPSDLVLAMKEDEGTDGATKLSQESSATLHGIAADIEEEG